MLKLYTISSASRLLVAHRPRKGAKPELPQRVGRTWRRRKDRFNRCQDANGKEISVPPGTRIAFTTQCYASDCTSFQFNRRERLRDYVTTAFARFPTRCPSKSGLLDFDCYASHTCRTAPTFSCLSALHPQNTPLARSRDIWMTVCSQVIDYIVAAVVTHFT